MVLMEVPQEGDVTPRDNAYQVSIIHSKVGIVFFDGLRVDLNFLSNALYYSKESTVLIFALNPGE